MTWHTYSFFVRFAGADPIRTPPSPGDDCAAIFDLPPIHAANEHAARLALLVVYPGLRTEDLLLHHANPYIPW